MTIRKLKLILRKSRKAFLYEKNCGHEPDFRVTICIETSRFFSNEAGVVYFDDFLKRRGILPNTIYAVFLEVIYQEVDSVYADHDKLQLRPNPRTGFKLFTRPGTADDLHHFPSKTWFFSPRMHDGENQPGYRICDYYFG